MAGPLAIPRAVLAVILVFFAPGFAWTLVLFRKLDVPERLALSIGLSIALVTLSILVSNAVFKVALSGLSGLIIILFLTAIPLICYGIRRLLQKKNVQQV
jgi:uncharacterized membrane protein